MLADIFIDLADTIQNLSAFLAGNKFELCLALCAMHNIQGSVILCDASYLMNLDPGGGWGEIPAPIEEDTCH